MDSCKFQINISWDYFTVLCFTLEKFILTDNLRYKLKCLYRLQTVEKDYGENNSNVNLA